MGCFYIKIFFTKEEEMKMLFNKKEKVEFNATQVIYPGTVEYDENQNLLMIKNGLKKDYVSPQDIEDILER